VLDRLLLTRLPAARVYCRMAAQTATSRPHSVEFPSTEDSQEIGEAKNKGGSALTAWQVSLRSLAKEEAASVFEFGSNRLGMRER
jgi:hypothetical protein